MKGRNSLISRRAFLERSSQNLGWAAFAGVAASSLNPGFAAPGKDPNPFAYDLSRVSKTDPKLVRFEETRRFPLSVTGPRRIFCSQSSLYVACSSGIALFDLEGTKKSELTTAGEARCVGIGSDGTVYAGLQDSIEVFKASGTRLATWPAPGKKPWYSGMAVGENDVFVADAGSRAVLRYDRSGKFLGRVGEKNKERNVPGFVVPSPYLDVKLAKDGLLRVNNPGRHRVEAYTPNGDFEFAWGRPSNAIDGFCGCCNPIGLMVLPDGRFVTSEKGLPRVKVYSSEGVFESVVAGTELFPENFKQGAADCTMGGLDTTADAAGNLYVLDLTVGNVRVMKAKA
jgi:hypothetical protein